MVDANISFLQFAEDDYPDDLPTVPDSAQIFSDPVLLPPTQPQQPSAT